MGKLMEDKSYLFLSKIYAGSSWYWLSPVIRVTLLPPPGPGEGGRKFRPPSQREIYAVLLGR